MKNFIMLMLMVVLQACGSGEENVDAQFFIDDFGTPVLIFNWDDCNGKISVAPSTDRYWIESHGVTNELFGLERTVFDDLHIEYTTENFILTKYLDGSAVYKYFDEECATFISQNDM